MILAFQYHFSSLRTQRTHIVELDVISPVVVDIDDFPGEEVVVAVVARTAGVRLDIISTAERGLRSEIGSPKVDRGSLL